MSASHSRAADLTRESSIACKSKEERLRTFRTSVVAALRWRVWRNSRVRLATSRFEATSHAMYTTPTMTRMAARTINQVATCMGVTAGMEVHGELLDNDHVRGCGD